MEFAQSFSILLGGLIRSIPSFISHHDTIPYPRWIPLIQSALLLLIQTLKSGKSNVFPFSGNEYAPLTILLLQFRFIPLKLFEISSFLIEITVN